MVQSNACSLIAPFGIEKGMFARCKKEKILFFRAPAPDDDDDTSASGSAGRSWISSPRDFHSRNFNFHFISILSLFHE